MPSDIPSARADLEQLAEDFPALADRLEPIIAKMHRPNAAPSARPKPPKSANTAAGTRTTPCGRWPRFSTSTKAAFLRPFTRTFDMDNHDVTAAELRQLVERVERIEADEREARDQKKEVYAEAKARGYDTRVMRRIVAERKRDRDDIAEEEAVLEMYKSALGMA